MPSDKKHNKHPNNASLNKVFRGLAAKNVRKSAKDYFIYFFTLMLSVALFYSFNSISTQFASLGLEDNLNYLAFASSVLTAFSVLVCVIMGALVVYANRFLLRRRKKEMGIYASLGLERRDLNHILMRETLCIGVFSLGAGIGLGIFGAQILSLATAKLVGIPLGNYHFMISIKGIVLSILFFGILFLFVHWFNVKELKKMSLLDMLYADKKNETVSEEKGGISAVLALLSLVFILGGYGVLTVLSGKAAFKALAWGGLLLIIGTVLFFMAALRIAARVMKKNKRYYYRGINIFTTSQFAARLKTEGKSLAMTCILIYLSLSLTILGPGIGKFVMNGVENATPYDGTIYYAPMADGGKAASDPMEYLRAAGFGLERFFHAYEGFWMYETPDVTAGFLTGEEGRSARVEEQDYYTDDSDLPLQIIGVDDYNRMLALQKIEPVHLAEDEFAISYSFPPIEETVKAFAKDPKPLNLGNITLTLAEGGILHHALENKNVLIDGGVMVVPQNLAENLTPQRWILNFNFPGEYKESYMDLYVKWRDVQPEGYGMWLKQEALIALSADNLLMTYLGIYLGITFLITSGAVLALQQLSQSSDNRKRYQLLKKLGVSKKDMKRSLRKQLRVYFGVPLILAVLHSVVTVFMIFRFFQGLDTVVITSVIGFGVLMVFTVFAVYFITTYLGSRRILQV